MILIIDSSFPLGKEEVFLNDEIQELREIDEEIVICPLFAQGASLYFSIPENIVIDSCCSGRRTLASGAGAFIRTLVDPDFWEDLFYTLKNGTSLKRAAACFYYSMLINEKYHQVLRSLKESGKKPRVIYSYWMHTHACVGAKLKKKFPGSRLITRCHGYDLYEFRSSTNYLPGRNLIFSDADTVISVSKAGAEYLESHYPDLKPGQLRVSYLGTYDNGLNPWTDQEFRIVSCSNLVDVKRVHIIIEALSLIQNERVHWTHYGDGELMDSLQELAKEKLHDNITADFRGYMQHDALMKEYSIHSIDAFLNMSASEGLPVSIMEAMSFGIPVIATDVGGTKEIVKDGYNGYLLNENVTPEELAEVLMEFQKKEHTEQNELRDHARITWEETFDSKKNYRDFYNKYLSC